MSFRSAIGAILRFRAPILAAAHLWRARWERRRKEKERINLLKRVLVILVTVFCAALLFAGTVKALVALRILNLESFVRVAGTELPRDRFGHTNVLLLGQGDADHDGIDLTDTIMIASIDPGATKSAVLLSLPRDLYFLSTERMGKGRINSLYRDFKALLRSQEEEEKAASERAMRELADEIGRAIGVEIHHVVKVDFLGFIQGVDAIGGVDVEVPSPLVDTEYPGPNYTYETFQLDAGLQHLDGETALKYARSRHSTSDFDRSRRQQQLLSALGEKVKGEKLFTRPGQILSLLKILQNHVETTLTTGEMVSLGALARDIDRSNILSEQLNIANGLYDAFSEPGGLLYTPPREQFGGASVLLPVSIPEFPVTWKQVQAFVQLLLHERTAHVERAPIVILNAGAPPGSARLLGGELIRFGFDVVATENAEGEDLPTSFLEGAESSPTAKRLSQLLRLPLRPSPVSTSPASETKLNPGVAESEAGLTITLGVDFEYAPLQSAIFPSDSSLP